MSETSASDPLQARFEAIAKKLSMVVGQSHPRLSDPSQRFTFGDEWASSLTYAQIVMRNEIGPSPDLIHGAVKCLDEESRYNLVEGHLRSVDATFSERPSAAIPQELAGHRVQELQDVARYFGLNPGSALHPEVEGYRWYRGYVISTAEQVATLLFEPWMQPWQVEGSPVPVVYTLGDPDITDVRAITAAYAKHEHGPQSLEV